MGACFLLFFRGVFPMRNLSVLFLCAGLWSLAPATALGGSADVLDGSALIRAYGWEGDLDIPALMETIHADMPGSMGVSEYRSDTGVTTDYDRDDLLEIMASELNVGGGTIDVGAGAVLCMGVNKFGGARFDERGDKMFFQVGQNVIVLPVDNLRLVPRDQNTGALAIDAAWTLDRAILADVGMVTLDPGGSWVEESEPVAIDPTSHSSGPTLLAVQVADVEAPAIQRLYFDLAAGDLLVRNVWFEQDASGDYVPVEGRLRRVGAVDAVVVAHALDPDDGPGNSGATAAAHASMLANDSSKGMQVWNAVYRLREDVEWRSSDGKFERHGVYTDLVFGSARVGTRMVAFDADGNEVGSLDPVAFVAQVRGDATQSDQRALEDGIADMAYLPLALGQYVYTIVHDGQRLVYTDRAAWRAHIRHLER